MSVSAALASNLLANGLPLRFCKLSIYGNRLKPEFFPNSMFSVAQVVHRRQQLVLLQKSPVPSTTSRWCCVKAFASSGAEMGMRRRDGQGQLGFDALLSMVEVLCIVPSVVFAVGGIVGTFLPGMPKLLQVNSGNVFLVWQFFLLMGAVVVGGLIRQRQWQRISRDNREVGGCDLIKRIEKVEEDLRSSVKIVRVLSRQLEKLGIRFRVTRKALKEPIAETAVLAQKNSEAIRALALQEDILEKELGEIQKVLLAMQEQQQKQLELILAVAKAGRLFENKQDPATDGAAGKINSVSTKKRVGTNGNQNPKIRSHQ